VTVLPFFIFIISLIFTFYSGKKDKFGSSLVKCPTLLGLGTAPVYGHKPNQKKLGTHSSK
jgi:hypothetical protein